MRSIARHGWRQMVVLVTMLLILAFLGRNLFMMQALQASDSEMLRHYNAEISAPQVAQPTRGTIFDSNGMPLVTTVAVFKLGAWPPAIAEKDRPGEAGQIANILFPIPVPAQDRGATLRAQIAYEEHYKAILTQLSAPWSYVCLAGDDSPTCPLRDDISKATADKLYALKLPGIDLERRSKPYYPNGAVASQVLGFVKYVYPEDQGKPATQAVDLGQYGLEAYYNDQLGGVPGHVSIRHDTLGDTIRVGPGSDMASREGAQLRISIDSYVQHYIVERTLAQAVQQYNALSGTIVVERPSDGAVLAMASLPTYDPRHWQSLLHRYGDARHGYSYTNSDFANPAISDMYEPGSAFKPITAAIGFDSTFGEWFPVYDSGKLSVDQITIQNWCQDQCSFTGQPLTVDQMLHYSSNVAATEFSRAIYTPTFYKYLDAFGFGQPTGVDLVGEVQGVVHEPNDQKPKLLWVPAYKDTTAYGQGIGVTVLQMADAYSALANGGKLMTPRLVQSISSGGNSYAIGPHVRRQVISANTSALITRVLVHSAIGGEACRALVPGYDVAAKTGTTLIDPSDANRTIASTAAYGPVGPGISLDQQVVVLITLNQPTPIFGSLTAAPAMHDILSKLFNYYHLPRSTDTVQPQQRCAKPLSNQYGSG